MIYDLIVIGAGSGGLSVGLGLHELGFKVLLIEKSDASIGGECLNNGCVPSKAFIHISKEIYQARNVDQYGLQQSGEVDLRAIWNKVQVAQEKIRGHENADFFRQQGLEVVLGRAEFSGPQEVVVEGVRYKGKRVAIATGSKPRKLQVPGVDKVDYYDNENLWQLAQLPKRMLFVGAGPISMELGQSFARLGSQVVMVEMADRVLGHEPPEVAEILMERSRLLGMEILLNASVECFTESRKALIKHLHDTRELEFDVVVVGIGRTINTQVLQVHKAGIKTDDRGNIKLDPYFRTTNKKVVVLGDAAGSLKFSHGAELQATTIISNFFSPFKKKVKYDNFSWVTFTDPEVATFGLSETEIKRRGIKYERLKLDFSEDDRAITSDYTYGTLIMYVKPGWFGFSDARILGGTMVAPLAGEMFQELVLAQSEGLGLKSIFNKIYAYPTASRVNKTMALNWYLRALKPWMTKLMKLIY